MSDYYFLERMAYERIAECRSIAREIRNAAEAERARRDKRRAGDQTWYAWLVRLPVLRQKLHHAPAADAESGAR